MSKSNPHYKEVSKKIAGWKQLKSKKDADTKLRSDLTTAESYANSQQYNQAIHYAEQISKKNPYYKDAQMKILDWKDAMLNMSNNNSNTYSAPQNTYTLPKKTQTQIDNCVNACYAESRLCEANCLNFSDKSESFLSYSDREKCHQACYGVERSCTTKCRE